MTKIILCDAMDIVLYTNGKERSRMQFDKFSKMSMVEPFFMSYLAESSKAFRNGLYVDVSIRHKWYNLDDLRGPVL